MGLFASLPSRAAAGALQVYSCHTPSGEPAGTEGWTSSSAGPKSFAEDNCDDAGGALTAGLREDTGRLATTDSATWEFEPPAAERLIAASLWRAGDAVGGAATATSYEFWATGPEPASQPFVACSFAAGCESGLGTEAEPLSPANLVEVPRASLGGDLFLTATCGGLAGMACAEGRADANGFAAVIYLYAADLTLEQEAGPTATNVEGELAGAATVAGTSDVSFTASDPGAGVYEAVFSVDGQVVQRSVLDEDGGRCRNVSAAGGLPAFLYVRPCPSSLSADAGFNTQLVGNGQHHLLVSVIDAAGNEAPVLDREINVDNPGVPGPANGANATSTATLSAHWASTRSERLTSRYGRSHEVLGQLTAPGGAPVADALVEVSSTTAAGAGVASASTTASTTTSANGSFTFVLPREASSRTLRFVYRSHLGASPPAATATLSLSVRAGLSLSISPRVTSVGRSIRFRGRLLGGPMPPDGKQLVLEARAPGGHWIEFDDVRTNARGAYRASYRFKFAGPASYQFRVLSEQESDYPYAQGASRVVTVKEL